MNRDDIIRMAREADVWVVCQETYQSQLERFAAIVAAAEREACAKVCDDISKDSRGDWKNGAMECEEAIRARGQ
jgi:hypothetical protein